MVDERDIDYPGVISISLTTNTNIKTEYYYKYEDEPNLSKPLLLIDNDKVSYGNLVIKSKDVENTFQNDQKICK